MKPVKLLGLVILFALSLSACDAVPAQLDAAENSDPNADQAAPIAPLAPPRQAPEEVFRAFMDAWNAGDLVAMYDLLSPQSRSLYPQAVFENRYLAAQEAMAFDGIELTINEVRHQGTSAAITYDARLQSPTFTAISDPDRIMRLVQVGDSWRIAWTPMDILKGLTSEVRLTSQTNFPQRGNIYDRNGELLVEEDGELIYLLGVREEMPDESACVDLMARIYHRSRTAVLRDFANYAPETRFHMGEMDEETYFRHRNELQNLCGIRDTGDAFTKVYNYNTRVYYGAGAAAHVTGFTGRVPADQLDFWQSQGYSQDDIIGRDGLEGAFERELAGQPERVLRMIEPGGVILRELGGASGSVPQSLTLTLDRDLQYDTMRALADAFRYASNNWASVAGGAGAVVMDVNTGEVLAMASYPTYNPAVFNPNTTYDAGPIIAGYNNDPRRPLSNHALREQYSPGSTYKIVTALAAANEGLWRPDDIFFCDIPWSGVDNYGDEIETRYDWRAAHEDMEPAGDITLAGALAASCNPFFWESAGMLYQEGDNLLVDYSQELGLGVRTGINLSEAQGNLAPPQTAAQAINNGVGQGDLQVTALQMAGMVSAIANGGTVYQPYIVQQIAPEGDGSAPTFSASPEIKNQLSVADLAIEMVQDGMCRVTSDDELGTAYRVFADASYTSCGKTGTAQAGVAGSDVPPHAWYVTFAPADDPEIAVAVVVPTSREGSEVAAPIARRILDNYFNVEWAPFPEWWQEDYNPVDLPPGVGVG